MIANLNLLENTFKEINDKAEEYANNGIAYFFSAMETDSGRSVRGAMGDANPLVFQLVMLLLNIEDIQDKHELNEVADNFRDTFIAIGSDYLDIKKMKEEK